MAGLELCVFAALGGHWDALCASPILALGSWADRLWVGAKAVLDYRLESLFLQHQHRKADASDLNPGEFSRCISYI